MLLWPHYLAGATYQGKEQLQRLSDHHVGEATLEQFSSGQQDHVVEAVLKPQPADKKGQS